MPDLLCVNVGGDDRQRPGSAVWIPPEFFTIQPYQLAHKDINELAVSNIIKYTGRGANENKAKIINEGLPILGLTDATILVSTWCSSHSSG